MREGRAPDDVAAGILWVAISFAGTLAMGRTFERERYNDTLRALILAPADYARWLGGPHQRTADTELAWASLVANLDVSTMRAP